MIIPKVVMYKNTSKECIEVFISILLRNLKTAIVYIINLIERLITLSQKTCSVASNATALISNWAKMQSAIHRVSLFLYSLFLEYVRLKSKQTIRIISPIVIPELKKSKLDNHIANGNKNDTI